MKLDRLSTEYIIPYVVHSVLGLGMLLIAHYRLYTTKLPRRTEDWKTI